MSKITQMKSVVINVKIYEIFYLHCTRYSWHINVRLKFPSISSSLSRAQNIYCWKCQADIRGTPNVPDMRQGTVHQWSQCCTTFWGSSLVWGSFVLLPRARLWEALQLQRCLQKAQTKKASRVERVVLGQLHHQKLSSENWSYHIGQIPNLLLVTLSRCAYFLLNKFAFIALVNDYLAWDQHFVHMYLKWYFCKPMSIFHFRTANQRKKRTKFDAANIFWSKYRAICWWRISLHNLPKSLHEIWQE